MKEGIAHAIFPKPVYVCDLGRQFTTDEYKIFEQSKRESHINVGNYVGDNDYILDHHSLSDLKHNILSAIDIYSEKIGGYQPEMKLCITQSWMNWTANGQFHHRHFHYNSLISGVLYIDVDENLDSIIFHKQEYNQLRPIYQSYNQFNTDNCEIKIKNGMLLLFPSDLSHSVDVKSGDNVRISLAFNTFFKGAIGSKRTKLCIP